MDKTTKSNRKSIFDSSNVLSKGGVDVTPIEWDWPIRVSHENHSERAALLRPILYEVTTQERRGNASAKEGRALSLNISSGGMLVLMDQIPDVEQVLKVYVPTPLTIVETPTLAEVRWTRKAPFGKSTGNGIYFVGLKFMF
jgi:hypothetical protein